MQGSRQLSASQQQAWDSLNDPEILKACIPGCEKFDLTAENEYAVMVAVKIGPVAAKFNGKVKLADIQAPVSYALQFEAQGGVAGFGQGESNVNLLPTESGCELRYTVHSKVGGKIAQLGQRLIDGVAKSLAEDFFKRFEQALQAKYPATSNTTDLEEQAARPQAKENAALTRNSVASLLARWVWPALGAVVVGLLAWFVMR